jgi:hypothetical protein
MRRMISHSRTDALRIVGYAWIGVFTTVTVVLFFVSYGFPNHAGTLVEPSLAWKFLIATILGAVFIYFYYVPLKHVAIEGASLIIWTAWQTAVVPLEEIDTVRQTRWLSSLKVAVFFRRVTIRFRNETAFGRSVMFVPELRTTETLGGEDPIVAELRRAAVSAVHDRGAVSNEPNVERASNRDS